MTEQTIFSAALDIPDPAERTAYLDRTCGQDPALRRQVEALLAAHDRSGFLDDPALQQMAAGRPGERPTVTADADAPAGPDTPTLAGPDAAEGRDDDLSFLKPPTRAGSIGRLDRYEVLEVLGRGGFGTVLRAFDDRLHRVVAIKVLAPQLAASGPARARFEREARAGAAVRDEHVVNIYEVSPPDAPVPYLVMEYVAGQTLQQKLDRTGPLSVAEVLRIGSQVAKGLAAAHATGLIHRDVKPSNILLENGVERVKLTDFGLARAADDASISHSGVVAGTPQYMAPEQAHGEKIDHRADLFSLGSVLYAMCTGRPPFRASTTMAVLKRVCEEDPRPVREVNPEVPDWLAAVIAKLHAKKPPDRFQSGREVAEVLQQHLAHLQQPNLVARPPAVLPPPAPPRRWQAGDRVLAPWETEWLYPATVQQTDADSVLVAYDDGDSGWLDAAAVRPLDIEPGARVFGWWNGPYYPGTVTARDGNRVHIAYDDGDSEWTELDCIRVAATMPAPVTSTSGELAAAAPLPPALRRLRAPAIGLFVTGILYWATLPVLFVARFVPGIPEQDFPPLLLSFGVVPVIAGFVFVLAAWKMRRGELYPLCVAAALLPLALVGEKLFSLARGSLAIAPGDFTALPFGIWALIELTRSDVRAAFGRVRSELARPTGPPAASPRRRFRWAVAVAAAAVFALVALGAVWFGRPALLYFSDEGELELVPEDGLTSIIVLQNPEGVIDGNKLHPLVTDWLSMKTPHTLKLPPGKYQLNAGAWPAGTRFIHWRATTSGPFGSRTLLMPAEGLEGWSTIVTVERGRRTTVRPVAIRIPPPDTQPRAEVTPAPDGFVPLFNGKDLAGWKPHPDQPGDWKVENGVLVGRGGLSHLFTERGDFADFHLRAQVQINDAGDGGVWFRSGFGLPGVSPITGLRYPNGYEVQVIGHPTGDEKNRHTGSLIPLAPATKALAAANEWFPLEVIARGGHFTTKVNGQVAAEADAGPDAPRAGHIALQCGGSNRPTTVRFRKIEIQELSAAPPMTAVSALRDAVAAKERSLEAVKTRYEIGTVSRLDLTLAQIELTEARVRLAEAEGDRAAVAARLQDLVAHRQAERDLTGQLVKAGRAAPDVLNEADARLAAAKARLAQAAPAASPVRLRVFTPGKDPVPLPLRGPAGAVTVVGDAWRIENAGQGGNFNVMVAQDVGGLPKDGVLVFRAKVKVEAKDKRAGGDLGFGGANEVFISWDKWPNARARYDGADTDWTEKEVRYPAAEVLKKGPTVYLYAGLHANGVLWLKDVELLHLPGPPPAAPPLAVAPFDAARAKAFQDAWAGHLGVPVEMTNSVGMRLRLIPPGRFAMGAPDDEPGRAANEGPRHDLTVPQPFYMAATHVTVGQFRAFVNAKSYRTDAENSPKGGSGLRDGKWVFDPGTNWQNPGFGQADDYPVTCVSWNDAQAFCDWLTEKEGRRYALPTEAQWEYACRAGSAAKFHFGGDDEQLAEYAWYTANSGGRAHAVGKKKPNAWGLHDMHGNAWQWTADRYAADADRADPGPKPGDQRVARGGSWFDAAARTRSAHRGHFPQSWAETHLGFRVVVLDPNPPAAPPRAVAPFDGAKAKDLQEAWARHLGVRVEVENSIGMKLRLIPPGEFTMGSTGEESGAVRKQVAEWAAPAVEAEGPPRKVTVPRPYYLATTEVTLGQFRQFAAKTGYKTEAERTGQGGRALVDGDRIEQKPEWTWRQGPWAADDDRPVVQVTLDDAKAFCKWLSEAEGVTYALPTEEQWEFACRAGTTTYWPTGNDLDGVKETDWVVGSSNFDLHRVGRKRPNPFGLYDMLGNAEELCEWEKEGDHLSRGGHVNLEPWLCRSASRWTFKAGEAYYRRGFRVAVVGDLSPKSPAPAKGRPPGKE